MKTTLLGSSPTLEGITKVITAFYMGSTIELVDDLGCWQVVNKRGVIPGVRVVIKRGRYRFESID
jgi:hypothetical protein